MYIKLKVFIVICFAFSLKTFAQTTYHVSTTGSDTSGNGTLTSPYATLQKAEQQVQAGDTVLVHQGTYRNQEFNDGDIWESDNLLKITANGSAGNYITFKPYPEDQVTLEFDGNYGILISNSSYIKIEGFTVKGIGDLITQSEADTSWGLYKDSSGMVHDLATELGIDINDPAIAGTSVPKTSTPGISKPSYYNGRGIVANGSHHVEITNNSVKNVPSSAIRVQQSDYVTVSNNVVFYNTYWTSQGVGAITVAEATPTPTGDTNTGPKIILEKNYVHHNENRLISWNPTKTFVKMVIDEGTGLFLTRNRDTYTNGYIVIANNISSFNGASGIVSHFTDRVLIEHNTVYKNGTTNDSAAGGIGINNTDDVTIQNNISYAEPDHWAIGTLAQPNTNLTITNNIVYNENGTESVYNNLASGWIEVNPLFNNALIEDYSLQTSSPAINAGTTTSQTQDFTGNLRDDNMPDIGAFEYKEPLNLNTINKTDLVVFPNPVTNNIVYLKGLPQDLNNITFYNQLGQQVYSYNNVLNLSFISLDVTQLQAGLYIIKTPTKAIKIIKQ